MMKHWNALNIVFEAFVPFKVKITKYMSDKSYILYCITHEPYVPVHIKLIPIKILCVPVSKHCTNSG